MNNFGATNKQPCIEEERGIAFLARAAARPSLKYLCPELFTLEQGQIIKVVGDTGCSALIVHLLSRALLPPSWLGLDLEGCGCGAILVDTDCRFSVLQLAAVIEAAVRRKIRLAKLVRKTCRRENKTTVNSDNDDQIAFLSLSKEKLSSQIKELINSSLKNFIYLRCQYSLQFFTTILCVDDLLAERNNVSMVCVDCWPGFYLYDRSCTVSASHNVIKDYSRIMHSFQALLKKNGIVLVFTDDTNTLRHVRNKPVASDDDRRIELFLKSLQDDVKANEWCGDVTHFVSIARKCSPESIGTLCLIEVKSIDAISRITATISPSGYKFNV